MLLNGRAPLPGEVMQFPDLAQTFRSLVSEGKDGFYKGRVAEAIVELIKSKGGVMELSDLAEHDTEFVEPISYTYGGEVTLYEVIELCNVIEKRWLTSYCCSVLPMVRELLR